MQELDHPFEISESGVRLSALYVEAEGLCVEIKDTEGSSMAVLTKEQAVELAAYLLKWSETRP